MAAPVRLTPQGGLAYPAGSHACSPCLRFHSGYNPADENLPAISIPVRAGRWLRQFGGGDLGRAPATGSVRHLQHRVGQRDRADAWQTDSLAQREKLRKIKQYMLIKQEAQ